MVKSRLTLTGITLAWTLLLLVNCSRTQVESRQTPTDQPSLVYAVQPAPELQPPEPAPYVHTVSRSGETLAAISRWYTGSADNWKRLVDVNKGLKPRRIKVGDKILIPQELMKTQQPMPAGFMALKTQEKRVPTPSTPIKPTETNRIELFGPIENNDTAENPDVVGLPLESIE
ncbi:MAG: LysM peptidoglycan-binding domain-containing protein [Desulfobacterales bacterium]|jgi:LysM repeat protein